MRAKTEQKLEDNDELRLKVNQFYPKIWKYVSKNKQKRKSD